MQKRSFSFCLCESLFCCLDHLILPSLSLDGGGDERSQIGSKPDWFLGALSPPQRGGGTALRPSGTMSGDNAHDSANGRTHFLPLLISSPHCHCDTPSSWHFPGSPGTKGITLALSGLNKTSLLPSYPLSFPCTSIFGLWHLGGKAVLR